MRVKIEGSVALVTGSNRGIGRALVEALLERGAKKVYATARQVESLADLRERYGDRVQTMPLDVTDPAQLEAVADGASDVQLLFNNAGVALGGAATDPATLEAARREMEVNYFGPLATTAAFAAQLGRAEGAAVVNVASIAGLTNFFLFPTYSASKAALHSLTQAQRAELGRSGVQVSGVYPGPVDTDMAEDLPMEKASPAEVAQAILDGVERGDEEIFPDAMAQGFGQQWLASPKASEQAVAAMLAQA